MAKAINNGYRLNPQGLIFRNNPISGARAIDIPKLRAIRRRPLNALDLGEKAGINV